MCVCVRESKGERESCILLQVIAKTRFPRWKKSFDIIVPRPMTTTQHRTLKVTIYNWDKFTHNHFMGQVSE